MDAQDIPGLYAYKLPEPSAAQWDAFVRCYRAHRAEPIWQEAQRGRPAGEPLELTERQQRLLELRDHEAVQAAELMRELVFTGISPRAFLEKHAPGERDAHMNRPRSAGGGKNMDGYKVHAALWGPKSQDLQRLLGNIGEFASEESIEKEGQGRKFCHALIERLTHKWVASEGEHGIYWTKERKETATYDEIGKRRNDQKAFRKLPEHMLLSRVFEALLADFTASEVRKAVRRFRRRGIEILPEDIKDVAHHLLVQSLLRYHLGQDTLFPSHYKHELGNLERETEKHLFSGGSAGKKKFMQALLSLDRRRDGRKHARDEALSDTLSSKRFLSPVEVAAQRELGERMQRLLHLMPPHHAQLLELRYGLNGNKPYTQDEAAVLMFNAKTGEPGITRQAVQQMEKRALQSIRELLFVEERARMARQKEQAAVPQSPRFDPWYAGHTAEGTPAGVDDDIKIHREAHGRPPQVEKRPMSALSQEERMEMIYLQHKVKHGGTLGEAEREKLDRLTMRRDTNGRAQAS